MDFAAKRLYASILVLAATPAEKRPAETATAAKVLSELHARAGIAAEKTYATAVIDQAHLLGGGSEPWLAFSSGGPGRPPPALELLRPAPEAEDDEWTLWQAFKKWTSPGQMLGYLTDGEIPDNELKELTKAVTVGVASTAIAGLKGAADLVSNVASFSFGKLLIALTVAGGGYYYFKSRKR